jgi:GxxExxY protein
MMNNQEIRKSGKGDDFADRELSAKVIESAIQVHKALGPGFLESFYEEALGVELTEKKIPYERQKTIRIDYKGQPIGKHRLDLLVDHRLVVELKTVAELDSIHFAVVRSYMKALGLNSGLILNFSTMPLTVKRVGPHSPSVPDFLIS